MRLRVSLKVASISMYMHTSIDYVLTVSKQCSTMLRSMEIGIAVGVTVFLMIVAAITIVVVVLCYWR